MALLALFLHSALRRKFRRALLSLAQDVQQAQSAIRKLEEQLDSATARIQDAEEHAGMLVPPATPKSGLNVSLRTQVIRMSRRGDRAEHIAASLSVPKREVELLLKVHRLAVDGRLAARATE